MLYWPISASTSVTSHKSPTLALGVHFFGASVVPSSVQRSTQLPGVVMISSSSNFSP